MTHDPTREPAGADAPYRDPARSVDERVEDLLARMTLPEKVGQMMQLDPRRDVHDVVLTKTAGSILHAGPEVLPEAVALAARTRLGIPLLTADDAIHGHSFWPGATILPSQLAMAATWDPDLVERTARMVATEVATTGLHWTFSPVVCITRDLRWGRVDETFGEDPLLIGELAAATVRGYQGRGPADPTAILACAKHFAGYSETQGGRDASEADLSTRKLRSWFLPPFERVAAEGCRTFMVAYQALDGVPVTANRWLLHDVLRGEWGFSGVLVTDWDNVGRLVREQRVCADDAEAAAVAVRAGNDLVMSTPGFYEGAQSAVSRGLLSTQEIDEVVRRVLRLKFELGLFEDPRLPDPERQAELVGCADHAALNLEAARRSVVLLRNSGILPLAGGVRPGADGRAQAAARSRPDERARTVLVVGPNSDSPDAQLGDWSGASGQVDWMPWGHPRATIETVLDGLRDLVPADWTVAHLRGAGIGTLVPEDGAPTGPDGQPLPPVFRPEPADPWQLSETVAAAEESDVVVAVVGDTVALTGECRSTATLQLQGGQVALLDVLAASGTPMVVVVVSSKPLVLPDSALAADALVQAFNPGMRGGRAVAELLLGLVEPSGRLPVSFARHAGQQPVYYNQVRGQHGDRYADLDQRPVFAFGEGLSYTTVEYADLRVDASPVAPDGVVRARVTLHNTGDRGCLETVQAYVSDLVTSVTWADRELKAFRQVWIAAGERVEVAVEVPAAACWIVAADGRRVVEAGDFELLVGASSRDDALLRARFAVAPA